jgi:dynein heavy chain
LNIRNTYSNIGDEVFNGCPEPQFRPMLYVLSFFHWNVNYDFTASDYEISYQLISLYLNKAKENNEENLPWETLRYLIGDAMYGGRVTDEADRRAMNAYLLEYMGDFIFDSN